MTTQMIDALKAVKDISLSDSALTTLLDFERVLDELDVYAFKNWKLGEVVAGPDYEKYFVSVTLMWPYKIMPDPRGGEQLLNYNCQVTYKKDSLEYPIHIQSPDDFKPGTKVAKTAKKKVWLVEVVMPKQLMNDISRGAIDIENDELDLDDINQAYENGYEDEKDGDQGQEANQDAAEMNGMNSPLGGMSQQPPGMGGM